MWAGVDVGGKRKGFHAAVVDEEGLVADPAHLTKPAEVADWVREAGASVVAVDSPRSAAPDGCRSRDCERDLRRRICGIRYTPARGLLDGSPYYAWIVHGLELYRALAQGRLTVIECFPTASFTRWDRPRGTRTRAAWSRSCLEALGLPATRFGQDGRDAVAAALTARAYDTGSFESIGDIVVPLPGSGDQNSSRLPSGS
jgi:predicted nuclease with RNAse H fold